MKNSFFTKTFCKVVVFIVSLCIIYSFSITVQAEGIGKESFNIHQYAYIEGFESHFYETNYGIVTKSYMYFDGNNPVRVEAIDNEIIIEKYSKDFSSIIFTKIIPFEMPIFGGFYCGEKNLFLVFGQENLNESDDLEVIRVIKYDYSWNKTGEIGFKAINTYIPFAWGSSCFVESDNVLYIYTCHEMYDREHDGLHHQSSMTLAFDTETMQVFPFWNVHQIYISHSFNQFIQRDGEDFYIINHGDTSPTRSIELTSVYEHRFDNSFGVYRGLDYYNNPSTVSLITFPEEYFGQNWTGVMAGGFELSNNNTLVAIAQVNPKAKNYEEYFSYRGVNNIYILIHPKKNFNESDTKRIQLTNYNKGDKDSVSKPFLVKISDNRFLVMWETWHSINEYYSEFNDGFYAILLDENGNKLTEEMHFNGSLSGCQPITYNGKVFWYSTGKYLEPGSYNGSYYSYSRGVNTTPNFYEIEVIENENSIFLSFSNNPGNVDNKADIKQINNFVKRFYKEVLGRSQADIDADSAGIDYWTNKLLTKELSGAEVAYGFVNSVEFRNRDLNNDQFVKTMYKSFFNREPDAGGYNGWYTDLQDGTKTRLQVFEGFTNSKEFKDLCAAYGIDSGTYSAPAKPQDPALKPLNVDTTGVDDDQLSAFVERLYDKALDRPFDEGGKEYWKGCIIYGHDADGRQYDIRTVISKGFLNSQEYKNRDRNNAEFVLDCYASFFNRNPVGTEDEPNYWNWVQKLNDGMSRQQLIENGFGNSPEFENLITLYGFKIIK